jgi:hypothetical protein
LTPKAVQLPYFSSHDKANTVGNKPNASVRPSGANGRMQCNTDTTLQSLPFSVRMSSPTLGKKSTIVKKDGPVGVGFSSVGMVANEI